MNLYLNSSLFEQTNLGDKALIINQLKNRLAISHFAQTVLKDASGKRSLTGEVPTLTYLLDFLNAYHFGSDDTGELIQDRPKDLISASVLGLIFEKLNGYKDGSFFTPSFIIMYMCHQSIRRTVVEKMSGLVTGGFKDFEDLSERLDYANKDTRLKANQLINSLHICDPAVGSGHFLVSALNELIQIKYDLKILSYKHSGKRIDRDWKIEIDNDELRITDKEEGNIFVYNPQNEDSQALQEDFTNTFAGSADMYVYFVERASQILKKNGRFTFIIPNKWIRAGYGENLRKWLKTLEIQTIIDFGDLPVFEEATTYPCVFSFQNKPVSSPFLQATNVKTLDFPASLETYLQVNSFETSVQQYNDKEGWVLSDSTIQNLLQKNRSKGKILS